MKNILKDHKPDNLEQRHTLLTVASIHALSEFFNFVMQRITAVLYKTPNKRLYLCEFLFCCGWSRSSCLRPCRLYDD